MKRAFVKSALVALAIMLISVSAFAADVSASVVMDGDLWGTNGFVLRNQNQKDADLIQISVSDAQFGASFRLWAPLANTITPTVGGTAGTLGGNDGGIVQLRKVNLWLKPIDMLKISLGNVSAGLFTEQLNWWMVPSAGSVAQFGSWNPRWNSGAGFDVEGGLSIELTPIEGLFIAAGIAPGYNNALMADQDADPYIGDLVVGSNTKFGVVAKYKINGIGTVGASYRYNGGTTVGEDVFSAWQNIRVGMDITMVPGLYAFLQGVLMLEQDPAEATPATTLTGVTIDNYVAYSAGAFTVKAEFPFTMRLLDGESAVPAYMTFDVKASYKLGNVSPFVRIRQNGDKDRGSLVVFYETTPAGVQIFAPAIDLGADMSLGKAAIMTAIRVRMAPLDTQDIDWSIPFNVRISW